MAIAEADSVNRVETLGSVRLHKENTREFILIPTPSNDPNDPLRWSRGFRYYLAGVVCLAMLLCTFLAAGPTVAIVPITIDFFGAPPGTPEFPAAIAKIAYYFTTTSLMQGMGNLIWMPLIVRYGRRPIYMISFVMYVATCIWAGVATSYPSHLVARILIGFSSGSPECIAPLTIADIFFLHERGVVMALYTAALSSGVSVGIVISGLITINHSWRYIYYVTTALLGAFTLVILFTMPETSFNRHEALRVCGMVQTQDSMSASSGKEMEDVQHVQLPDQVGYQTPEKKTYRQSLRLYNGVYTDEPVYKVMLRPAILLLLPPVLWATLCMSVTIGFLVAIASNFAAAFAEAYHFQPWQSGLCFISGIVGSLIGVAFGGKASDWTADIFTRRNNGIREPEHRLPAIIPCLITAPLALILFGVGVQDQLHWMVPTLSLGFLNFAITAGTTVSLVYTVDAYRPIAEEVVTCQLAFKSAFGFLLSFYTNPWVSNYGYATAYGTMAAISGGVLILWVPLFFWGKAIRHATLKWPIVSKIRWHSDREVGE